MDGLFAVNGYDGLKANNDWQVMNTASELGRTLAYSRYAFLGIFGLSAYQCTKLATLSPHGKMLAPVAAASSLFLFQASFSVQGAMRRAIAPKEAPPATE